MTDWSKFKVTELKDECKARDIPLTGLKLKQQFIDTLTEYEARVAQKPPQTDEEEQNAGGEEAVSSISDKEDGAEEGSDHETTPKAVEDTNGIVDTDRPAELKKEDTEASEQKHETKHEDVEDEAVIQPAKDTLFVQESEVKPDEQAGTTSGEDKGHPAIANADTEERMDIDEHHKLQTPSGPQETPQPPPDNNPASTTDTPTPNTSSTIATTDIVEDLRKRKRRSTSPIPDSNEIALKKAKTEDGSAVVSAVESSALGQIQEATNAARALRSPDGLDQEEREPLAPIPPSLDAVLMTDAPPSSSNEEVNKDVKDAPEPMQDVEEQRVISRSASPMVEDTVSPAIHPATKSLYIRNFKRPLHIPSLRSHISSHARGPNRSSDHDAITTFYLDSIRTHAFVSFDTISSAARVRSSMHNTRYPDEPIREPLFVDFIPDDKVQAWIDQESGQGGFGRRSSGVGQRYEVLYIEGPNGIEASLQEASGKPSTFKPPTQPARGNSYSQQPPVEPVRPSATTSSVPVHPDRARLVPQTETQERPSQSRTHRHDSSNQNNTNNHHRPRSPSPKPKPTPKSKSFQALDTLFQSTTISKPKLYYLPASPNIVDSRLSLIKDLRLRHDEMGRSGDEGMKRYTFEAGHRGREEWVDKGPEFGFGRRGVERLAGGGHTGYGRGARGGFRGTGYSGGRGRGVMVADTWRR